jgi:hypothetical protein
MLKSKKSYLKRIVACICALVSLCPVLLASGGCNHIFNDPSDDHYTTMEVKNRIAHFSFEYRTYYHTTDGPDIVDDEYFRFTYVTIAASKKTMPHPDPEGSGQTVNMKYTPAFITIQIGYAMDRPYSSAHDRIENHIKNWGTWPNFKLFERKTIVISGKEAEMASYQVDGMLGPKLLYQADVAFDYNWEKWDIHLEADITLAESVQEDLDHIIRTFKILE